MNDSQDPGQPSGPTSGLFHVGLPSGTLELQFAGLPAISKEAEAAVSDTIQRFSEDCQMMLVWYVGVLNSRQAMQKTLDDLAQRNEPLQIRTVRPDGRVDVVLAQVPVERVIDAITDAGEFERQFAKAFVVNTATAWEHGVRPTLAAILQVAPNDIECPLMGELTRLRNWLLHPTKHAELQYFDKAKTLAQNLGSTTGDPNVTAASVLTLMRLLNNMSVMVDPHSVGPAFELVPTDPAVFAAISRTMDPNTGAMLMMTMMQPSPVFVNFDDKTATIHEKDCPRRDDEFTTIDGARQLVLTSWGFARAVIAELALQEQRCTLCGPSGE